MNRFFKTITLAALVAATASTAYAAEAPHQTVTDTQTLTLQSAGSKNFTGVVVTARLYGPQEPSQSYAAVVTFSPGARTHWHIHDMGQTLIVTDGIGWTQEWGKEPVMLKPGDLVRCPPGVKHWHGGSAKMSMTHIALSEAGGKVTWLEPVSDEEYPRD